VALRSPEFLSQVPMNKRELLLERAKKAKLPTGPGYVTFQDFVNVVSAPQLQSPLSTIHYPPANWPSNRVTKVPKLPCVCLSLAAHQRQTRFKCKHRCKVLGQDDDQSVGSCSNRTDGGQGFLRPGKSHTLVWQMQKVRLANKCNAYGYTVKEMGLLYRSS